MLSPLIITLVVMGFIFTIAMALRTYQRRTQISTVGAAMARNMSAPDMRQMKLRQPFSERVVKPLLRQLYNVGRILTPTASITKLQESLIVAGLPGGMTVTDFLGLRFLAAATLSGFAFAVTITQNPSKALLFALCGFGIGLYVPNMWLNSKAKSRQKAISRALPDMLDMMSICVDAGLGFEAALQKVAFQSDGELALEMRRVISEIRVGVARGDALRHLAERTKVPDVASFVAVLIQADRLGIAIRNVLSTQSVQMRIMRRQRAEEEAGKAPIKMLIPLGLFIFPAMFIVILGPAVPRILEAFK